MRRARSLPIGDPILFWLVLLLASFGVAMVYSAGVLDVPSTIVAGLWRMQLLWFVLALIAIPVVLRVPVIWLEWIAQPLYAFAIVLLILTLFIGGGAGPAESMSGWRPARSGGCGSRWRWLPSLWGS
jgi:cell division protein FtsW (lipid II flippase)